MEKLIDLGFENVAEVSFRNPPDQSAIEIEIRKFLKAKNILYAFIFHAAETENEMPVQSEVRYIGHTRKTFRNRMNGYQSGNGASNLRVNKAVKKHLATGGTVNVFVLSDRNGLYMHEIHIDVAAGLEYSLIDYYCRYNHENGHSPLLNIDGNTSGQDRGEQASEEKSRDAQLEWKEENIDYPEPPRGQGLQANNTSTDCQTIPCQFAFPLTPKTYWPQPVFNVPAACERHFGPHGDILEVQLTGANASVLQVVINRTANPNESPRIYFGSVNRDLYEKWKQSNHAVNETVTVNVIGKNQVSMA